MLTKEECHEYWKNTANDIGLQEQPIINGNNPILYANKPRTIIDYLHNFWIPEVSKKDKILELGCNSGANLNHLRIIGYNNTSGIDINEQAIHMIQKIFPETFKSSELYIGSIEEILTSMPDKSIDATYSMYTLSHIHPSISEEVFRNIVRITKKYIVTIEEENESINERVFIRDYKKTFENLRCRQIRYNEKTKIPMEIVMSEIYNKNNKKKSLYRHSFDYHNLTSRLFEVI